MQASVIRAWVRVGVVLAGCAGGLGCSSSGSAPTHDAGTGGHPDGTTGHKGAPDAGVGDGNSTVGQLDAAPDSGLPPLPALTNVVATERPDSVGIDFDPVDNAVDYRVYPLPDPRTVKVNADGSITIPNAIYRCAGVRETFNVPTNLNSWTDSSSHVHSDAGLVFGPSQFPWGATVPPNPTLGYVYPTAAPGRTPIYAVAVHLTSEANGWNESQPKIYTADATERQTLLAAGGQDLGIVFYVPEAASSSTQPIYHSETANGVAGQGWTLYTEYYFGAGDLGSHSKDTTPPAVAFQVLAASAPGAVPLMAVLYSPTTSAHTELSAGMERFNRAANQGPSPLWHVEWSGLAQPTILVVEALASGCPYQGYLSPQHVSLRDGGEVLSTLAEIQAASPTGEVYVNGQYDLPGAAASVADAGSILTTPSASPVPIARSFVRVTPQASTPSDWDWYQDFSTSLPDASVAPDPLHATDQNSEHWTSPVLDIGIYSVDRPGGTFAFAYGTTLGELWTVFDDFASDTTGKLRFTAAKMATVPSDPTQYLHVTWTVNIVGTDRRYPQMIVTDQKDPVQDGFLATNSNNLLLQTRFGPSMKIEMEAFHGFATPPDGDGGIPWDINHQGYEHFLVDDDNWQQGVTGGATSSPGDAAIAPSFQPLEHAGIDRMTRFDAYISTARVYLWVDGVAAGCSLLPDPSNPPPAQGFALSGPVTVTFGDVLYHEGAVDEGVCYTERPYPFLHNHECALTKRHWDDLGFKSGVPAPAWNETLHPCAAY